MEGFWQGAGLVLLTVFFVIVLGSQGKEIGFLATVAACCFVGVFAIQYLRPLISFMERLKSISDFDSKMFSILLKSVGVGFISEIACQICADSGNAALGKTLQILTSAVILWISLPVMEAFLELVDSVVGEI